MYDFNQAQIRVIGLDQNEATPNWSEKFSLDVIKSTGMTSCKVTNDRIYTVKNRRKKILLKNPISKIDLCRYCNKFIWFNKTYNTFTIDGDY
jgi:hypothetical protein